MAISHGMNVEEIEAFGNRLQQHFATRLHGIADEIETVVRQTSTSWVGPDAEKFRGWWPAKRGTLRAAADDVHGFGQSALNNAAAQREASGAQSHSGSMYSRPGGSGSSLSFIGSMLGPWGPDSSGNGSTSPGEWLDFVQERYGDVDSITALFGKEFGGKLNPVIGGVSWGIDTVQWVDSWNEQSFGETVQDGVGWGIDGAALKHPKVAAAKFAWDTSYKVGDGMATYLDDRFDTSGAFFESVVAREGKIPDYDGVGGFVNFAVDGVQNVFSPKSWGFR